MVTLELLNSMYVYVHTDQPDLFTKTHTIPNPLDSNRHRKPLTPTDISIHSPPPTQYRTTRIKAPHESSYILVLTLYTRA